MTFMLHWPRLLAALAAAAVAVAGLQDPAPAPAPAPAPPRAEQPPPAPSPSPTAPPTAEPGSAAPAPAGVPAAHPFEGVYTLRARVAGGRKDEQPSRGYLAITKRHVFLCLAAPGPDAEQPLLRAGVRTWKPDGEFMNGTVQLGWFNDVEGEMHLEPPGTPERRRVQRIQGGLRIMQDATSWLEFERIE